MPREENFGVFSQLRPWPARTVLIAWALLVMSCVAVSLSPYRIDFNDRQSDTPSDVDLYWAEVRRMKAGESYYQAAARELPARNFPTSSVFNWRTPLPMWLLARMPDPLMGRYLLGAGSCLLLVLGTILLGRDGGLFQAAVGGIFLGGAILPCLVDELYVTPILWAAVLLGLSVCGYGFRLPYAAVLFGITAAFFRELAVAYCGLMLLIAVAKRRRGEAIAWCAALAVYAVFYALHAAQVGQLAERDNTLTSDWVQFNGLAFLVGCAHMNGILMPLPQWVAGIYLSLSLLGLASWCSDWSWRAALTTFGYGVAFLIVGQEVNQYWGTLLAPLLCFGVARGPSSLVYLWRQARITGSGLPRIKPS
jgi:hypothetical protein